MATAGMSSVWLQRFFVTGALGPSRKDGLDKVPEELFELFGKPELAMTLILTADKKLARTDGEKVLQSIDENGFYLQMPPARETYMLDLFCKLDKE